MSVVCLGPQAPSQDLECIDVKKESVRQAAAGMFICVCMYVCMYILCMYVCMYVCMYIWYLSHL